MIQINRVAKFLVSGVTAATVEYLLFLALYNIGDKNYLALSQSLSFLGGFIVSFLLNKNWVFKSSAKLKPELIKYGVLAGINIILTNILISTFITILHMNPSLSKILVMGLVAIWNYLLFSKLIFRDHSGRTTPAS